jgi:hypothetical protein
METYYSGFEWRWNSQVVYIIPVDTSEEVMIFDFLSVRLGGTQSLLGRFVEQLNELLLPLASGLQQQGP